MPRASKAAAKKADRPGVARSARAAGRGSGAAARKGTPATARKGTSTRAGATRKAPVKKAATKASTHTTASRATGGRAGARAAKGAAPRRRSTAKAAVRKAPAPKRATPRSTPSKALARPAPRKARRVPDKFLEEQRVRLLAERETYMHQAEVLRAEADQLAEEMEPGDIQFDEESGEGATMNVERERDLTLSAQARAAVEEIDRALAKIDAGTYGLCEQCGQPIPRARLKALPYASLCVACKSGGLSRR